jgi:WD40 repeat protein
MVIFLDFRLSMLARQYTNELDEEMSISVPNLQLEWQTALDDLVTELVWSPNGREWVGSSAAGAILWVSEDREPTILHESAGYSIDSLSYSTDGRWLAAGGRSGILTIWSCEVVASPPQLAIEINIGSWIEHLAWYPAENWLAIANGRHIKIWDVHTNTEIISWSFDKSAVFDLAWHPGGKYLAVAGYKGVQIWELGGVDPVYRLDVDTASLNVAWSHDGRYLVAGNLDRTLTLLDWDHPQDPWILQGCPGKIRHLTWLNDEIPCLAVATGTVLVLWTLTPDSLDWVGRVLEGHEGVIGAISAHPQTPILISGDTDGYACLWSATGSIPQMGGYAIEQIITSDLSEYTAFAWHPHGKYLATGTKMGEIELWSA